MTKLCPAVCLDGATLYPSDDSRWAIFDDFCRLTVYDRTPRELIVDRSRGARLILTNKTPLNAETIAALPDLKYIGVLATGYNIVDVEAARKAGITVTNIPAYSTRSVAQTAIAILLAITNRVEHYSARIRGGAWADSPDFSFRDMDWSELAGKTFGVVGFGNIGSTTAGIARALGMNIAVFTSKRQEELPEGYRKMDLDELFAECDVVSLHCPLTPETFHLADQRRIGLMKPTAILINTARGQLIDEEALAQALAEHRLFAAGVDVLSQEPPAADNPLALQARCFVTPHIAWASTEARTRLIETAAKNIAAYLKGEPVNTI